MTPTPRWGIEIDREGRGRTVTVRLGALVLWACLANGNEELLTSVGGSLGPVEWRLGAGDPSIPLENLGDDTSGAAS